MGGADGILDALAASDDEQGDSGTQATQLIALASSGVELFHAPDGDGYALVDVEGHRETWRIASRQFSGWLQRRFFGSQRKPPQRQAVSDATSYLAAVAEHERPEHPVHVRVAGIEDRIYLDLANASWQAVEVTATGWSLCASPSARFRRPKGVEALPVPVAGGSIDELRAFVNVRDEESFRLIVAWLIAALRPTGPYPVLAVQGEQGSAKSTTSTLLRSLIDPNFAPLRRLPREERDFMLSANNCHVLVYDNLSGLQPWHSDILCCLATGGGFSARQLYTDGDEVLFRAQRPVILNGIDSVATRGDLIDRSLVVTLPAIPEEQRRDEATFWAEFELARPRLLGALLDAVAVALREISHVQLRRSPRMADFAKWATAAESGLGWACGSFMDAYESNRSEAVDVGLEADVLAVPLRALAARYPDGWEGTAAELLETLAGMVEDSVTRRKSWPATPAAVGNRVRRLAASLRQAGWVEIEHRRTGERRIIRVTAVQNAVTPVTPVTENDGAREHGVALAMTAGGPRVTPAHDEAVLLSLAVPPHGKDHDGGDGNDDPLRRSRKRASGLTPTDVRALDNLRHYFDATEIY